MCEVLHGTLATFQNRADINTIALGQLHGGNLLIFVSKVINPFIHAAFSLV
jgi:hypothetical protein